MRLLEGGEVSHQILYDLRTLGPLDEERLFGVLDGLGLAVLQGPLGLLAPGFDHSLHHSHDESTNS